MQPVPVADRRAGYTASSHTLSANDRRIRELAKAMLRLNAEGGCTETLLLQEGFSQPELALHGRAARLLADKGFVRQIAEEAADAPFETDEQLLDRAHSHVIGVFNEGLMIARLRELGFTVITIERLWTRLMVKLGRTVAATPIPAH